MRCPIPGRLTIKSESVELTWMLKWRWSRWALLVLFWATLALFFASQSFMSSAFRGRPITWRQAFFFPALDCGLWALLSPLVLWGAKRFPFEKGRRMRGVSFHLIAGVAFPVGQIGLFSLFVPFAYGPSPNGPVPRLLIFRNVLPNNLHVGVLTYAAIVAVAHGLTYYQRYRDRELQATQLEARLAEAQLQALRMQLHPHFLFNTLHSISALVHEDPEGADQMLTQLADLLRMTLAADLTQEVTLRQELDFVDRYLQIEKTRLGERLRISTTIAPETFDARLPQFVLQPLVENAIRYAVAPRAEGGSVEIRAMLREGALRLEVWDDGPGLASPEGAKNGAGLALANTRARIAQLYGPKAALELVAIPGKGVQAALTIPFRMSASGTPGRSLSVEHTSPA